jgi:NAD(P)H-hydrate epimerase
MQPAVLTREQVRRIDALAIERYGMSGLVLMENAGRGAVDAPLAFDPSLLRDDDGSPLAGPRVVILSGKGNNAGDGFVIARHLEIRGVAARVLLLAPPDELTGDAKTNFAILQHTDVQVLDVSHDPLEPQLDEHAAGAAWLVDALLGTGAAGEPREPFATAIRWMNAQPARRLAVDLPSGLDCDTGQPAAATVRADLTVTFVAAKPELLIPQALSYVGELSVTDIGVPPRLVREVAAV